MVDRWGTVEDRNRGEFCRCVESFDSGGELGDIRSKLVEILVGEKGDPMSGIPDSSASPHFCL